jgi:ATP-binding cassette, subfamily G (WHITE), member 2
MYCEYFDSKYALERKPTSRALKYLYLYQQHCKHSTLSNSLHEHHSSYSTMHHQSSCFFIECTHSSSTARMSFTSLDQSGRRHLLPYLFFLLVGTLPWKHASSHGGNVVDPSFLELDPKLRAVQYPLWMERELQIEEGSNATDIPPCPAYRWFDNENPLTPIYGAPSGCRCLEGLEGLNCGYCLDSQPCQEQDQSHVCRQGFVNAEKDTYKAYQCRTANQADNLFPNGKAAFYLDLKNGYINVSIFNTRNVDSSHLLDCTLSGCESKVGEMGARCELLNCSCTEQCFDGVADIVNDLSGKPADLRVAITEEDEKLVSIIVEDSAIEIEALCTASACTEADPEIDTADFEFAPLDRGSIDDQEEDTDPMKEDDHSWSSAAELSLTVLCIIFAIFVAVGSCALVPFLLGKHSWKAPSDAQAAEQLFLKPDGDSIEDQRKHVLEFLHLNRKVKLKGKAAKAHGSSMKAILNDVSGSVQSGSILGIMGPSGAGKSTLLNTLAAVESTPNACISGQIRFNGNECMHGYKKAVAYVHQDDALYGTLTVQECIEYSAMMRLPIEMETTKKQALVWKTLEELYLLDIAHNRIGSHGHASVSGGERRRVSIGMEIVAMPTVICLDEPTSGLDSFAANNIMDLLSEIASRNRIVILSIHQPSIRAFLRMDQVLVLGGGSVMYNGKPSAVRNHLEERGFSCPDDMTVPDFMLDIVSDQANREILKESETTQIDYDTLHSSDESAAPPTNGPTNQAQEFGSDDRPPIPRNIILSTLNEVTTLFTRTTKDNFRNMELFLMQSIISLLLALFVGGVFNDVSNNLAGFQNRLGAFYFSLSFFGFASFSSMDIFLSERHIFERETGAKMYSAFSYFVAKTSLDLFVLRVIPVTIFTFVFYWLMGLGNDVERFLIFWTTMVLFNICAGVMSICISTAASTVGQANLIAVVWFLIMLLFGGFLVNIQTMAPWYSWLRYLSIFYYSFELLVTNELNGLLLAFDAPGFPSFPVYGHVFVETIGMDVSNQSRDIMCLCGLGAGFALFAYLLLLLRVPPSAASFFKRMKSENAKLGRLKPN